MGPATYFLLPTVPDLLPTTYYIDSDLYHCQDHHYFYFYFYFHFYCCCG